MGVQNSINTIIGSVAGAAIAADLAESKKEAKIDKLKKEDASLQKEDESIPLELKKQQTELLNAKDEKAQNKMSFLQGDIDQYAYNIANRNAKMKVQNSKFQKEQLNKRLGEIKTRREEIAKQLGGKQYVKKNKQ